MRTECGKSAEFTMRFTMLMIPAGSTPIGTGGPDRPLDQIEHELAYKNWHNGPYVDYNKLRYAQMPDCDCYTPDE